MKYLFEGPENANATILLAHGAGRANGFRLDERDRRRARGRQVFASRASNSTIWRAAGPRPAASRRRAPKR